MDLSVESQMEKAPLNKKKSKQVAALKGGWFLYSVLTDCLVQLPGKHRSGQGQETSTAIKAAPQLGVPRRSLPASRSLCPGACSGWQKAGKGKADNGLAAISSCFYAGVHLPRPFWVETS